MKLEITIYTVLLIVVGGILAALEFGGQLEHKLTTADFLVNVLIFLFTLVFAEVIKLIVRGIEARKKGDTNAKPGGQA
jgi:hypothetical protein